MAKRPFYQGLRTKFGLFGSSIFSFVPFCVQRDKPLLLWLLWFVGMVVAINYSVLWLQLQNKMKTAQFEANVQNKRCPHELRWRCLWKGVNFLFYQNEYGTFRNIVLSRYYCNITQNNTGVTFKKQDYTSAGFCLGLHDFLDYVPFCSAMSPFSHSTLAHFFYFLIAFE